MLTRPTTLRRARKAENVEATPAPEMSWGDLGGMLGFHMRMAYVTISRRFSEAMTHLDLTQKQTGVLWLIGANAGASQITLATALDMDRASMMAIVDRLQDRGLIVRERSPHDGRRQELYLTPKGRKVLLQSKTAMSAHEQDLIERFDEQELAQFMEFLGRLRR